MSEKTNTREKKENLQPGDLNQYIRLTTISTWLVLGAFLVFVIGLIVWGFTGRLVVSVDAVAVAEEKSVVIYIPEEQFSKIKENSELVVENTDVPFGSIPEKPASERAANVLDEYQRSLANLSERQQVLAVQRSLDIPDGSYKASIILERIKPFDFLFGGKKAE